MQRRSWLSFILLLCLSFNAVSGGRHHHSSAILVGTVSCDTYFISGATVAVECGGDGLKSFREEVTTNEEGEFEAKLPVSVGENVDGIKRCSVKLVSSGESYCAVGATATSSEIRFTSKKVGSHVFSAGDFTFKPEPCSEEDFVTDGFLPPHPSPGYPIPALPIPLPPAP